MSEDKSKRAQIEEYHRQTVDAYLIRDYNKAESIMAKMVELDPDNPEVYYFRADFYESLRRPDEAIAEYNKTISLAPKDAIRYAVFAEFFARHHQTDNALFNYDKAVELNPPLGLLGRAEFYDGIGRIDKALADYNKVVELEPKNIEPYLARSEFYQKQLIPEKLELAFADAQTVCELQPENHSGYFRKGLVLLDLHRYSEASQSFETALKNKKARLKAAGGALAEYRTDYSIQFYLEWAAGLSAYYQADDPNQAKNFFTQATYTLDGVPADLKDNYNIIYIAGLLEAYLQLIPLDNELKQVLSEPDKLTQRTEFLDGLRESFSGMFKRSNGMLVEIDMLLEAKRDICALLLPIDHLQSITLKDSEEILKNIQGNMEFLKYEHTTEILRILRDNRQRLEQDKPFSKELTKMGDMADGMMTFGTSGSAISDRMGEFIKVPEAEEEEITLVDPKTGSTKTIRRKFRYITKENREYKTLSGREEKPLTPAKVNLVNVRELIMQKRKDAGLIIPPQAHEALMQFISRNTQVKIETFIKEQWQEIGIYLPSQLEGFQHKQGDSPLMVWTLLVGFALTGPAGHPPPEGEDKTASRKSRDKFRKQIEDLNKKLQRLLGITDDAIIFDRQTGNWKPVINLRSSRHSME